MLTAVEVGHPLTCIEAALSHNMVYTWIGARTTGNPFAMQEIADTIRDMDAPETPELAKESMYSDGELWIGALERLYNAGVKRLRGHTHRGVLLMQDVLYRNRPQWRIPWNYAQVS